MGKPAPTYWWDINNQSVIVQSDYPGGECLARYPVLEGQGADLQIATAETLIEDFEAGRRKPDWGILK